MSWNESSIVLKKLNRMSGLEYRLLTGDEFVKITKGGVEKKDGLYSGETINEVAWYLENSGNEPHKVGLKQPNELGIYDMFGNVWEW